MSNFIDTIKWFFRITKENFIYKKPNPVVINPNRKNLSIMTFNIRRDVLKDGINNWQYRKENIVKMIQEESPDIICMQEVMPHMAKYLYSRLSSEYYCRSNENFTGKKLTKSYCILGEGLITFVKKSKCTVAKKEVIKLFDGRVFNFRRALKTTIYDSKLDKPIIIYNTHLCHKSSEARKKSITKILDDIFTEKLHIRNDVYICGDFNCEINDPEIKDPKNLFYRNPENISTINYYSNKDSHKTIDFIFSIYYSKSREYKVINDKILSDHYPVIMYE